MNAKKYFFLFYFLHIVVFCEANQPLQKHPKKMMDDYFRPDYLQFDNVIYKNNIKTVLLSPVGNELGFPIIAFNSNEKLNLSFDDLDADRKTYNYTVIHCDAAWNPTNLTYTEYIDGYHDELITEYKYSFNTIQTYTHFNLVFPTEGLRLKKSGNFIIKVFLDYNEDSVVFTKRFMVYDKKVELEASAKAATIISDRYSKQEIDFTINNGQYQLNDPYDNVRVTLIQNQRFDNAITTLQPQYVKENQLVYDYDEGNVFNAGNEFRYFDDKNFRAASEKVNKYIFDAQRVNNIYLIPEEKKAYKRYVTQSDINGNFVVRTLQGYDGATDADYAQVHFYLPYDQAIANADVYVFGACSNWKYLPEFKMNYDTAFKAYTAAAFLKQGYYNYEYVVLKDNQKIADESIIEGNHFETENDYYILIYYKAFGTYYDQLIGYKKLNTAGR